MASPAASPSRSDKMTLPTKTIPGFVSDMIATWNAQTGLVATFESGDVLLAFWQSVATQFDFLQAQIATVLKLTRAKTSRGIDLDSWMAQFDFARLAASYSTGTATFGKNTAASAPIVVPVGSIIQTTGGALQYAVVADTNNGAYSAAANGYVLPAGQTSINATTQALAAGGAYNVAANTIVQIASSIPGIDTVTNGAAFTNGINAESDDAFRSRFVLYLSTLAKATKSAILAAALGARQGLSVTLIENQRQDGTAQLGSFTAIVDDGSGSPPASTISAVYAAVDKTRAFSVQPYVVAPTVLTITIAIAVRLATGIVAAVANTAIANAISLALNALGPGATAYVSTIDATALLIAGVVSVRPGTTINGSAADFAPSASQEVRTTVANIAVSNY